MYDYLIGTLVNKSPTHVIIEVQGVGYFVHISLHTYGLLKEKRDCKLYISFQVREDAHTFFGFADESERQLFEYLISVSGIGPNTGRMMLSSLSPEEIQTAIVRGDVNVLKQMKGIGPKTAQRLILELQDKLKKLEPTGNNLMATREAVPMDEAMHALLMLGFQKTQVDKVINSISKEQADLDLEGIIKAALKKL